MSLVNRSKFNGCITKNEDHEGIEAQPMIRLRFPRLVRIAARSAGWSHARASRHERGDVESRASQRGVHKAKLLAEASKILNLILCHLRDEAAPSYRFS